MPHVNMTFPFLPDRDEGQEFKDAARDLTEAFKVISPFRVILTKNSFSFFSHKKFSTMWLNPIPATTSSEATGTTAEAMSCGATFSEATGTTGEAASPGATDKPRHATIMKMQKVIQEVIYVIICTINNFHNHFTFHLVQGCFWLFVFC